MGIHFSSKKKPHPLLHFQQSSVKPFKSIKTNETSFFSKVKLDSSPKRSDGDSDYISPLRTLNSKANWSPEIKELDKRKLSSLMESLGINVNQKRTSQFRIKKNILLVGEGKRMKKTKM